LAQRIAIVSDLDSTPDLSTLFAHVRLATNPIVMAAGLSTFEAHVLEFARTNGVLHEWEQMNILRYGESYAPLVSNIHMATLSDIRLVCGESRTRRTRHFISYCKSINKIVHLVDAGLSPHKLQGIF
jgi:hypothetical protein